MEDEKQRLNYIQGDWSRYNYNQSIEKIRFLQLLNLLVNSANIQEKFYLFGRPSLLISDIIKCCLVKVYTNLSCRRVIPELREIHELGFITHVPHYNRINSYMREKWLIPILKELIEISSLPFSNTDTHFAVDATGFSNNIFKRWFDPKTSKYGKRKDFLKLHLVVSTDSMIIPTAEVTMGKDSENPLFKKLIDKTAKNFKIDEVYADNGYSSRNNYELVARKGGKAYIPFRSNSSGRSRGSLEWRKAFDLWKNHPEEFNKTYHRRSLVESTFSSIKRVRLNYIRSKNLTAGRNEVLLKVLCRNLIILANLK